jgi:hypothetical protein
MSSGHEQPAAKMPVPERRYIIESGVDPSNDWRAPYRYWGSNHLLACAAALEELVSIMETNTESGAPDFAWEALNG